MGHYALFIRQTKACYDRRMTKHDHQLADLLLAIEAEMRRVELWESQAPSEQALQSLMPFCHDTLRFEQWLQWVFLPRMKIILENEEILPQSSDIHPLAEYALAEHGTRVSALLQAIAEFDRFIGSRN